MIDPKTLTVPDWRHIYEFVSDVLETIKYDDTGVTDDLIERAAIVAEILKLLPMAEDDEEE